MKTKKRYRILLHAMTFKRDFSFIYVLSKLLGKMGCECIIVNNTNLNKKYFKLWNPDAIFFVTLSHAKIIKSNYPNAKLFLWTAEGGYDAILSEELSMLEDEEQQNIIDRVYLWGQGTFDAIEKRMSDLKFSTEKSENMRNRYLIAGNPRMDICKFSLPVSQKEAKKINIGFIGSFYYLNNKNYHPFTIMLDSEFADNKSGDYIDKLDEVQYQIRQLKTYCNIMTTLGTDKYTFSLRPYPLENVARYKTLSHAKKFPFKISTSLDFSSWVMQQDIIIGGTSTTIAQIAVAGKSYINVDNLNKRTLRPYDEIMSDGLKKHQPSSYSQLLKMIENYKEYVFDNLEIHKKMNYYYNSSNEKSVICEVAKDMYRQLSDSSNSIWFLNKSLILLLDNLWSSYIERRCADELKDNYSYFRRSDIISKAEAEFDPVIENIAEKNM